MLTPYGEFELHRYPARRAEPLKAWCAADSLLLDEAHARGIAGSDILAVNDEHGALCVALEPRALWTDSALSEHAALRNLQRNGRASVPVIWSTSAPACAPALVVIRVPRQLSYFEYQLATLARSLPAGATVLAAGMDKHLSPRTAQLLEQHIGPTERHRGQRKARLFSATRDLRAGPAVTPTDSYFCEPLAARLQGFPTVFSRERLDIGSRFLLQQLPGLAPAGLLVDLACGNGVLGLAALQQALAARVLFCDESAMAIASARLNADTLFPGRAGDIAFHHGDGLLEFTGEAADLILCNPPFHLNHAVDEFAGRHLLAQCSPRLRSGGRLCLVANRHLDYRATLRRGFARVEKLAQDSKFIVWLAQKSQS